MSSRAAAFACSVFIMGSVACGSIRNESTDSFAESTESEVDTSNPVMVAEIFYDAVDRKDMEAALLWILPEQRAELRQAMEIDGMPDLPGDYEVYVEVRDDIAEASILATNIKIAMILIDGRWWVCD